MPEVVARSKILLVEDESYVRDVAYEILQEVGYEVVTARNGSEAIRLFEEHGPMQLLVTDMVMPGMSGRTLADKLTCICAVVLTLAKLCATLPNAFVFATSPAHAA
jgi:CheY-like chemotaxis protein